MQKTILWVTVLSLLAVFWAAVVACGDDDDDDNDTTDPWADYPITFSGTMSYDGDKTAARIMIAITDQWPMTGAPLWFDYVDIPAAGFPFDYKIGVDQPFVGEYYIL